MEKENSSQQKIGCVLKTIKEEFTLGTDFAGFIDIPSSKLEACGLSVYEIRRIFDKFVSGGYLKQIIFLDEKEAEHEEEYDYDVWRIQFPANFLSIYEKTLSEKGDHQKEHRLIDKDAKGVFSYNGSHIEMSNDKLHYFILDALFSFGDQSGFLSYEDIEKHLVENQQPEVEDFVKRDKRIQNAISNQLFRAAKVNGKPLRNRTLDGEKLIKVIRGKGIRLNNSKL